MNYKYGDYLLYCTLISKAEHLKKSCILLHVLKMRRFIVESHVYYHTHKFIKKYTVLRFPPPRPLPHNNRTIWLKAKTFQGHTKPTKRSTAHFVY